MTTRPDGSAEETSAVMTDSFLVAAIDEARKGLAEGGVPIGSVLVHVGRIIGRGHNRRVQSGSVVLHGEMDAPFHRDFAGNLERRHRSRVTS